MPTTDETKLLALMQVLATTSADLVAETRRLREQHAEVRPALEAYAAYLRRLADAENAEAAAGITQRAKVEREREAQQAKLRAIIVQIVVALGSLALGALGMSQFGGS